MIVISTSPRVTFRSIVTDIRLESRVEGVARWQIALEETRFSPDSPTGKLTASAPSGVRLDVPILGIVEEKGTIWHRALKPIAEGTQVVGEVEHPRALEPYTATC